MKKNTKILICGLGSIGQRHYKNLLSLGYRNIIVYRTKKGSNQGRVDSFSTEYKPVVFTDLDAALFENPEVVFVTNPTSLHVPTALKAAQRGAHLFIEKPISHALDNDLKKLERVVKSKSLKVFVAYQFRFHPLMRKIKEIVNDKKLGNILSVSVMMGERVIDWHPWENYKKSYSSKRDLGGGVVLTQSHDLDYLTWVFGRVKSVKALGGSKGELGIDVEDTVDMLIDFEIGVKALVHLDYVQSPGVRILTLVGTKGNLVYDFNGSQIIFTLYGKKPATIKLPKSFERNRMYLDEIQYFMKCIDADEEPFNNVTVSIDFLTFLLDIKKQLRYGK